MSVVDIKKKMASHPDDTFHILNCKSEIVLFTLANGDDSQFTSYTHLYARWTYAKICHHGGLPTTNIQSDIYLVASRKLSKSLVTSRFAHYHLVWFCPCPVERTCTEGSTDYLGIDKDQALPLIRSHAIGPTGFWLCSGRGDVPTTTPGRRAWSPVALDSVAPPRQWLSRQRALGCWPLCSPLDWRRCCCWHPLQVSQQAWRMSSSRRDSAPPACSRLPKSNKSKPHLLNTYKYIFTIIFPTYSHLCNVLFPHVAALSPHPRSVWLALSAWWRSSVETPDAVCCFFKNQEICIQF